MIRLEEILVPLILILVTFFIVRSVYEIEQNIIEEIQYHHEETLRELQMLDVRMLELERILD